RQAAEHRRGRPSQRGARIVARRPRVGGGGGGDGGLPWGPPARATLSRHPAARRNRHCRRGVPARAVARRANRLEEVALRRGAGFGDEGRRVARSAGVEAGAGAAGSDARPSGAARSRPAGTSVADAARPDDLAEPRRAVAGARGRLPTSPRALHARSRRARSHYRETERTTTAADAAAGLDAPCGVNDVWSLRVVIY